MTIHLRKRKQRKTGKTSLYLEIYKGKTIQPDGKIKYIRDYEFLNMYLIDKPKSISDKTHNKNILQMAENIKNQRELELYSGRYGFNTETNFKDTNFYEYFYNFLINKDDRKNKIAIKHFRDFAGEHISFAEITEDFCNKYLNYLQSIKSYKGTPLNKSTVNGYFHKFSFVIRNALKDKVITENPLIRISLLKTKKPKIIYLTSDELKLLVKTNCKHTEIKRAFIFSCLTGLRFKQK